MSKYQIAVSITVDAEDPSQAEKYSAMIEDALGGWDISTITISDLDKVVFDQKENGFYIGLARKGN